MPLGVSYQDGAAHVDLSPRATLPMSRVDTELFTKMIQEDIQWFFELVSQCGRADLLIVAGCLTKKPWYISKFIEDNAAYHNLQFNNQAMTKGEGKTSCCRLSSPSGDLPAFYCSVSPSARNRHVLVTRIKEHKEKLIEMMNERPASART